MTSYTAMPFRRGLLAAVALVACSLPAHAQSDYPNRPIQLIVPFAPGGVTDASARIVAAKLAEILGQTIVVDNRAGAAGNIGTQLAARAEPNGYTLLLGYDGTLVINPNVYAKVPFDSVKDFVPIGKIGDALLTAVVNPKVPAANLTELQALARSMPGGLSYGSAGTGSTTHLAGEMLRQRTGMPLVHIPYKGGGPALTDVAGGSLSMTFASVTGAMPFVKSGAVKAIGVTSRRRAPSLPDVPTFIEMGMSDYEISSWVGLLAPAKTPRPIIDKLNQALQKVLTAPEMVERLSALGVVATPGSPEAYGAEIVRDLTKNKAIVKAANITLD